MSALNRSNQLEEITWYVPCTCCVITGWRPVARPAQAEEGTPQGSTRSQESAMIAPEKGKHGERRHLPPFISRFPTGQLLILPQSLLFLKPVQTKLVRLPYSLIVSLLHNNQPSKHLQNHPFNRSHRLEY